MEILEACLQQPILEQEVRNQSNCTLVTFLLLLELFYGQLVEQLAELSNRVRNDGDFLKHLTGDCIDNVEELWKHLPVKRVLSLLLDLICLLFINPLAIHPFGIVHWTLRDKRLLILHALGIILLICFLVVFILSLQVLDCEKACVDAFALDSEQVVQAPASLISLRQLLEEEQ